MNDREYAADLFEWANASSTTDDEWTPVRAPVLRVLAAENERLRAAVVEGDRRVERLRESIHPTVGGYCPVCGGGCLIGFATPTPARDAVREIVP